MMRGWTDSESASGTVLCDIVYRGPPTHTWRPSLCPGPLCACRCDTAG
jgi:hypothetical protein